MSARVEEKHRAPIRWMHWINFPLLAMMMWSGLLIYWANPVYALRLFGHEVFYFFPQGFYSFLGVPYRLAEGMQLHFFFMWLFAANGVAYAAYLIFSGEYRSLVPTFGSFERAFRVALYELHISKKKPPQGKYNDAQRIVYTLVILMGAGSIVTGVAIYKPLQASFFTSLLGGYEWARWEHFWLMILFAAFFCVHVVQVVLAGWKNFQSMVTGVEVVAAEESSK
ncbi:MAG TPA: cytochrome b/b6 domain-containing protein [Pyrinomonadaceae bacterium]|nr:cytochrome b/b6 domain-containing protein [Pyrinomonadaceae bacterium]